MVMWVQHILICFQYTQRYSKQFKMKKHNIKTTNNYMQKVHYLQSKNLVILTINIKIYERVMGHNCILSLCRFFISVSDSFDFFD